MKYIEFFKTPCYCGKTENEHFESSIKIKWKTNGGVMKYRNSWTQHGMRERPTLLKLNYL